jgi:hypothetical protein
MDSVAWKITGVGWPRRGLCRDEGREATSPSVPAVLASPMRSGDLSLAKDVRPGPHRSVWPPRARSFGEDFVERRLQVVVLHRFGQHARGADLVGAYEGSRIGGPAHHEDRQVEMGVSTRSGWYVSAWVMTSDPEVASPAMV